MKPRSLLLVVPLAVLPPVLDPPTTTTTTTTATTTTTEATEPTPRPTYHEDPYPFPDIGAPTTVTRGPEVAPPSPPVAVDPSVTPGTLPVTS